MPAVFSFCSTETPCSSKSRIVVWNAQNPRNNNNNNKFSIIMNRVLNVHHVLILVLRETLLLNRFPMKVLVVKKDARSRILDRALFEFSSSFYSWELSDMIAFLFHWETTNFIELKKFSSAATPKLRTQGTWRLLLQLLLNCSRFFFPG